MVDVAFLGPLQLCMPNPHTTGGSYHPNNRGQLPAATAVVDTNREDTTDKRDAGGDSGSGGSGAGKPGDWHRYRIEEAPFGLIIPKK